MTAAALKRLWPRCRPRLVAVNGKELELRQEAVLHQQDCTDQTIVGILADARHEVALLVSVGVSLEEDGWAFAATAAADNGQSIQLRDVLESLVAEKPSDNQALFLCKRTRVCRDEERNTGLSVCHG
jgi:hypothetical protein